MFDDPSRQLRWMEQELLATEAEEEGEFCEEAADTEYDDDDLMQLVDRLVTEETGRPVRRRNPAVDYPRMVYDDEEFDESAAVLAETSRKRQPRNAPAGKAPRKKGIKGLVFLALLEIAGILGIIGWWLRWLI